MDDKIKEKLEEYNLRIEDLTVDELEELKKEILAEEKGCLILDGVLSNKVNNYYSEKLWQKR